MISIAALALCGCSTALPSQSRDSESVELSRAEAPTYADLVTFAMAADLAAIVTVEDQRTFPPERAPNVSADRARVYIESLTRNLLVSPTGVGESLIFVTDVARDADGDAPDLEGRDFVIFADLVPGRPGDVRLVETDSFFPAGPDIEARVRQVLRQLAAGDVPPAITGVRDVISVEGNLAGESETQMFIETASGAPVSLSVIRRPGMRPQWGVSLGEIVDTSARPPDAETPAWFRLACGLPASLSDSAFLQSDRRSRDRAREDYAFVLRELGACERRFS